MSDHIPFEIQSEIMKRLPVKSLIQFRSVSKQWKSLIDSSKFIKNYHINHTNPQHHLLVRSKLNNVQTTYTSIVDNNTFPQQKLPLTAPESFSLLTRLSILSGSVNGLLCYHGFYNDTREKLTNMAVIWNPAIRKSVGIVIPKALYKLQVVGFGVCPRTSDPKLVKISVVKEPSSMWVVEVFTLSRRVWETVYMDAPFKSCDLVGIQVSIDGVIYWLAYDDEDLDDGLRSKFIISFDLKSYKFGEVCLPERLVYAHYLLLANMNESLVLLEYNDEEDGLSVCSVWMRKDGENKPFTKIYTVKVEDRSVYHTVLGFRKNGEAVLEVSGFFREETEIDVYEPSSGRINNVGIVGKHATFSVRSYMETLLLLDEPNTIIHS